MKIKKIILFLLISYSCFIRANQPQHLIDLRELLEFTLPQATNYQHEPSLVQWGNHLEKDYKCYTDCSGLIDAVFLHAYGISEKSLKKWLGSRQRPKAKHYFEAIKHKKGFEQLVNIQQIVPGDIIAIRYLSGTENPSRDTGHILIVNEMPNALPFSSPFIANHLQWSVNIIDCTNHGHGIQDSRYLGHGRHRPGIGQGNFRLYTDYDGRFFGYSWSLAPNSRYYQADERPFVIGRFNSCLK